MRQKICIISGPTAVGKSDISIRVAKAFNGSIISADSAQVYKYMDIGTAKLSKGEMEGIDHYLIDEIYPDEEFSVAIFRKKARQYINKILSENKLPLIVGGTGFYIKSLLKNLDFTDSIIDKKFRYDMEIIANEMGNEYLHKKLEKIDSTSYKRLHHNDIRRVIRALEVYKHTGKPISFFQNKSKQELSQYDFAYICINASRDVIYDRINARVDSMITKGLIEEVSKLLDLGYNSNLISMQAIGYKEIICYIEGKISKLEAIELIKRNTRRYAKRQLTWFRTNSDAFWLNIGSYISTEMILENIVRYFAGKIDLI